MKQLLMLALLPCAFAAAAQQPSRTPPAPPSHDAGHVIAHAAAIKWGPPPPGFEPGAHAALIAGDPATSGDFVVRLKMPAGYRVARHWHPTDEQVTVLQGALAAELGPAGHAQQARVGAGDFVLMPARMPHQVSAQGETIVQVQGRGPFEIHYVDPKDDPRTRKGAGMANGQR